jgi:hypothetical protein
MEKAMTTNVIIVNNGHDKNVVVRKLCRILKEDPDKTAQPGVQVTEWVQAGPLTIIKPGEFRGGKGEFIVYDTQKLEIEEVA